MIEFGTTTNYSFFFQCNAFSSKSFIQTLNLEQEPIMLFVNAMHALLIHSETRLWSIQGWRILHTWNRSRLGRFQKN